MVDAFQGQEKTVIIVHFIAAFDVRHQCQSPFGFVRHENRLIVATIRARESQFLVGNCSRWEAWRTKLYHPYTNMARFAKIVGMMNYAKEHGQIMFEPVWCHGAVRRVTNGSASYLRMPARSPAVAPLCTSVWRHGSTRDTEF